MTRSREAAPIRRRHHLSLSALVLLAVLAIAASGFAPAAPAEPGDAVAPVGGTSVDELLRGPVIDGRDDPRARAAAMQTFVTQRWELPDTSTPSPAADAADAAVADTATAAPT